MSYTHPFTFRLRRGDAAEWTSVNPVLSLGEPGIEMDTESFKIGDGVTAWNLLPYMGRAVTTAVDGGTALSVAKTGLGAGDGLTVANHGTGRSIVVRNATTDVSAVLPTGEFENFVNGGGVILRSPNGTRFRVTVGDDGALITITI